jgi:hypothetical protein
MTMKSLMTVLAAASVLILSACGRPQVSFDTLETARMQARENAIWNAQRFRQTDPRFASYEIIARGDSTQSNDCPQGDGWVSIDFFDKTNGAIIKTKCSDVSGAVGCMTDADFKTKVYAQEEGHCASTNTVPFPFRKIAQ